MSNCIEWLCNVTFFSFRMFGHFLAVSLFSVMCAMLWFTAMMALLKNFKVAKWVMGVLTFIAALLLYNTMFPNWALFFVPMILIFVGCFIPRQETYTSGHRFLGNL